MIKATIPTIYKKVSKAGDSNNLTCISSSAIKAANNTKFEYNTRNTRSFINNSNTKNSYILDRSTSKPTVKTTYEINSLSELTQSTRKDKDKSVIKSVVKPYTAIHNNKSRNPRTDSYLKTNSMISRGTNGKQLKTVDKDVVRLRNTVDSIRSKSGMKKSQSRGKDIALLSTNYLLLKQKVDQLRTNLENRSSFIGIYSVTFSYFAK
jgi:hypothetical protein